MSTSPLRRSQSSVIAVDSSGSEPGSSPRRPRSRRSARVRDSRQRARRAARPRVAPPPGWARRRVQSRRPLQRPGSDDRPARRRVGAHDEHDVARGRGVKQLGHGVEERRSLGGIRACGPQLFELVDDQNHAGHLLSLPYTSRSSRSATWSRSRAGSVPRRAMRANSRIGWVLAASPAGPKSRCPATTLPPARRPSQRARAMTCRSRMRRPPRPAAPRQCGPAARRSAAHAQRTTANPRRRRPRALSTGKPRPGARPSDPAPRRAPPRCPADHAAAESLLGLIGALRSDAHPGGCPLPHEAEGRVVDPPGQPARLPHHQGQCVTDGGVRQYRGATVATSASDSAPRSTCSAHGGTTAVGPARTRTSPRRVGGDSRVNADSLSTSSDATRARVGNNVRDGGLGQRALDGTALLSDLDRKLAGQPANTRPLAASDEDRHGRPVSARDDASRR